MDLVTLLINTERPVAFHEIRDHFDDYGSVSPDSALRKFERDKADLLELGIPVEYLEPEDDSDEEGGGYRVDPEAYFLPPIDLKPDELALLTVAGAAARGMKGFPWPAEVARALEKIAFAAEESGAAPAAIADRLAVRPPTGGDPARVGAYFGELRGALARQKTVDLVYHGLYRDETSERTVEPYGLLMRDGTWCLYAHCRLRDDRRTFHLDRIEKLEVNRARPKSPDYELPDDVDLATLAQQRPWEYAIGAPVEVTVLLEPYLAFSARALFGQGARVEMQDDGRARVRISTGFVPPLIRRVLSLGDGVLIEGPPEVRAQLVEHLEATLR